MHQLAFDQEGNVNSLTAVFIRRDESALEALITVFVLRLTE